MELERRNSPRYWCRCRKRITLVIAILYTVPVLTKNPLQEINETWDLVFFAQRPIELAHILGWKKMNNFRIALARKL